MRAVLLALLFSLTPGARLGAQPMPAAGSPVDPDAARVAARTGERPESHGWVVIPGVRGPVLMHVPPRGDTRGVDGADLFSRDGSVHHAAALVRPPEAMAAWGRRVYLVFGAESMPQGPARRTVMSLEVEPTALTGLWADEDGTGPRILPSLLADGPLLGVSAEAQGLTALVGGADGLRLFALAQGGWEPVNLPWADSPPERARLLAGESGPRLVESGGDGAATVWEGTWEPEARLRWSRRDLGAPDGVLWSGSAFSLGERLFAAERDDSGTVRIIEFAPGGSRLVSEAGEVGPVWGIVPLAQSSRAVLLWMAGDEPPGAGPPRMQAAEVSLLTGRLLHRGEARAPSPISPGEIRWLAIGLLGLMVVVLAVVLRSEGDPGVAVLPDGYALAPSGARLLAGLADGAASVAVARIILGVEWAEVFDPSLGARTLGVWGLALLIGFAHCTVLEWLAGRTLGKALVGIRVARTGWGPDPVPLRKPTLAGAAARNAVRWLFAPYAALSLLGTAGRHRGDVLGRTAVVMRIGPESGVSDRP